MNKLHDIMIFAVGVAVGTVTTWRIVKKKYEQIAQEEIDSVKEAYKKNKQAGKLTVQGVESDKLDRVQTDIFSRYSEIVRENGYSDDTEEIRKSDIPYVITPEQFGELADHEKISLTYFLDGVLVDDDYQIMNNIDEVIGMGSLNHFGEYEDDSVFVRNDRLKCDYEILLDQRDYKDVLKTMPHRVEV